MINFFSFSFSSRLWIAFILGVCVSIQTLALVLTYFHSNFSRLSWFENLLELFILLEFVVIALLFGQVLNGYKIGLVIPSGYREFRIAIFIIILVLVIIISYLKKTALPFIGLLASSISLPTVEKTLANNYAWMFLATLILLLARSIIICVKNNKEIKTNISALSVPHAINTMHTGVLYSEANGQIILCNNKMQDLMILLTGSIYRNATKFYDFLASAQSNARFDKVELEGQMVCLLPDKTAWMFTRTEIPLRQEKYSHISASDVSEQWALTMQLQQQNQVLKDKSNMLKQTMTNLYTLCKEKEIEYAKTRAHDILGQRLSVMLRIIQDEKDINYELLSSLSKGLLEELTAEQNQTNSMEQVKNIQDIFTKIGVDIDFKGEFPKQDEYSDLFIDIIRESTTNAVRHGFATKVVIRMDKKGDVYHLVISNNGYTSNDSIRLGSGIKEMRRKTIALGGQLFIQQQPMFTLSVMVSGEEEYEKDSYCG